LKPDTTAYILAHDLQQHADLKYPTLFRILVRLRGEDHKLQAGEYLFLAGSTTLAVLDQVVHGKVMYHAFTIVNGWNYYQVMRAIEKNSAIKHTLLGLNAQAVAKQMHLTFKTPEGLLFPETYYYTRGTTDLAILQRAYQAMQKYLQPAWQNRATRLPYKNSYTALIVASMLEKETSLPQEKPIIAAIILKRLQEWMPLQIDATVIYGMGKDYQGNLTRTDLRKATPYNTYVHYGLPPTPIAMPGASSIQAALHPAVTDKLYFVAKKDGSHVFSKTLAKHRLEVEKYQIQKEQKVSNYLKRPVVKSEKRPGLRIERSGHN
jgi:UPF0755 protein